MWHVVYCTDGKTETAKTTVENDTELRIWVADVDLERGVSGSVFDEESYDSPSGNVRQWGTGYWWVSMTRKGSV